MWTDGSTDINAIRLLLIASGPKLISDDGATAPGECECVGDVAGLWTFDELRDSIRFFDGGELSSPVVSGADVFGIDLIESLKRILL